MALAEEAARGMRRLVAAFLNLVSGGWFGPGTPDDFRNPFWRWTESRRIEIFSSITLSDLRIGFFSRDTGKWVWYRRRRLTPWVPGRDANFYNGVLTLNRTVTIGKTKDGAAVKRMRFNLLLRIVHSWWFAFGVGILPDRGEWGWTGPWLFGFRSQLEHNPGCIAPDHEEGSV